MFKILFGAPLVIFMLTACSDDAFKTDNQTASGKKVLTFTPRAEEERLYQLHTQLQFLGKYRPYHSLNTTMLMRHQVTQEGRHTHLLMTPDYFHMSNPSWMDSSNMDKARFFGGPAARSMLADGMTARLDRKQGALIDFKLNSPMADIPGDALAGLQDELSLQLQKPLIPAGIALKLGAQLELDTRGKLPAITATIIDLDDHNVRMRLQGENDEAQLFGYLSVERDSGWPLHAGIIAELPVNDRGSPGRARLNIALRHPGWPYPGLHVLSDPKARASQWRVDEGNTLVINDASEDDIFNSDTGLLLRSIPDGLMRLMYDHRLDDSRQRGKITFHDLQAFDLDDAPLDLPLHALETRVSPPYSPQQITSEATIWPLGWHHKGIDANSISSVEATISWYPQQLHTLILPLGEQRVEREKNGARAILEKSGSSYTLSLYPQPNTRFLFDPVGATSITMDYPLDENTPDWEFISTEEQRVLHAAQYEQTPYRLHIETEQDRETLLLQLAVDSDQPQAQRRIRFHLPDPFSERPLYVRQ